MQGGYPEIIRCPPERVPEAVSIVLAELAPSQRREIAASLLDVKDPAGVADEALYVAIRGRQIHAAAWGQRQPGHIAVLWPPKFIGDVDYATACALAESVVADLDAQAVEMSQVLVAASDAHIVQILTHVNFRQLAELLYLACEAARFPRTQPTSRDIEFTTYNPSLRARLINLIERTYEGTLDCPGLNGVRDLENVITGYQATGAYRPENWLIVTAAGAVVGTLLLADHPKAGHWELMYMGLTPEARGRGWGRQITQHAQWLAGQSGVERIVLAVDSLNAPALHMYRSAGFEMWDRRTVYVRLRPKTSR
jgi:ribosomal protein S18 acetylase RimI-like enzyme